MGEAADRDAVDAGLGDGPDVGQRDAAGHLQNQCGISQTHRFPNAWDRPVIKEDRVWPRMARCLKLSQVDDFNLDELSWSCPLCQ